MAGKTLKEQATGIVGIAILVYRKTYWLPKYTDNYNNAKMDHSIRDRKPWFQ